MLIRKNCNCSACVVIEDVIGTIMESMHSMMMIMGDECDSLPKYLEATENRYQVAKESQFDLANEYLRDACMTELESRG